MTATPTVPLGRLRDSRDIASVLRGGRRRAGRLAVLHARRRDPSQGPSTAGRAVAEGVTDGNAPLDDVSNGVHQGQVSPGRDGDGSDRAGARIAVTASRKVGSAVARNRAKRLLREAARRIEWEPGTDVVLVARRSCASSTMPAVLEELRELAEDLGVTRRSA